MAEPKRVPLQSCPPLEPSVITHSKASATAGTSNNHNNASNSNKNKSEEKKKKKKDKQIAPSIRFNLNLFESNDQKYPEFNYADLLKNAEKKRKREKKKEDKSNSTTNGTSALTPFDDTDEDEKVLDVARYFEEKYGNRKKSDYVDLGAGYDESDSFIDNTDMYDELVPQEVTTVHGGFYVNSGPLEFKDSDNVNELLKRHNLINNNDEEDDDESSDDDSEDEEKVTKHPGKRPLSSDNEEIDITVPAKSKPRVTKTECA
ncbi:yemanuclein [Copidosoma floridanum]|uniref:yemanuclein n=1 Tax=Copidosoma floridanum TaxID=29053 RepID=UPI0006C957AE|nr:yemanuclein [Copidosoma floridanum]XP_014217673.1 yemanuclein [Copidosoma floridanum]